MEISMLKDLSMKILLMKALKKMLGYVKFMNNFVTKKRARSYELTDNEHHCSPIAYRCLVE